MTAASMPPAATIKRKVTSRSRNKHAALGDNAWRTAEPTRGEGEVLLVIGRAALDGSEGALELTTQNSFQLSGTGEMLEAVESRGTCVNLLLKIQCFEAEGSERAKSCPPSRALHQKECSICMNCSH